MKSWMALTAFVLSQAVQSQNEFSKWYFGTYAGLDFMTSPPTVLSNGSMLTTEGCSTMSDSAGNLLFYTNGVNVYDRTHSLMANGTGLTGHVSTTQSALIVKRPGSADEYYVFTLGAGNCNAFNYSIVDMSLAAGLGSVTVKNATIASCMTEKMCGVRSCSGQNIWIITHEGLTNSFYAWLLTAGGLSATPVISTTGMTHNTGLGSMKVSPNGKKLGLTLYTNFPTAVELFDFDPATGVVSAPITLALDIQMPYGCEFSADGTKFYCTSITRIFQWDICGNPQTIAASQYTFAAPNVLGMQRAPDGKIYIASNGTAFLGVINSPNVAGAGCNFAAQGVTLYPQGTLQIGLPNFVSVRQVAPFTFSANCLTTKFTSIQTSASMPSGCTQVTGSVTSVNWNFGDVLSGAANTASVDHPVHVFSSPGAYTVTQVIQYDCGADTVILPVAITAALPTLSVAGPISVCKGESRTYTVSGASTYQWFNNAVTPTTQITHTATKSYSVTGTGTCSSTKFFTVTVDPCTGIEDEDSGIYRVFPSPVRNQLFIDAVPGMQVVIADLLGNIAFKFTVESSRHQFDVSAMPSGVYILSAYSRGQALHARFFKTD